MGDGSSAILVRFSALSGRAAAATHTTRVPRHAHHQAARQLFGKTRRQARLRFSLVLLRTVTARRTRHRIRRAFKRLTRMLPSHHLHSAYRTALPLPPFLPRA